MPSALFAVSNLQRMDAGPGNGWMRCPFKMRWRPATPGSKMVAPDAVSIGINIGDVIHHEDRWGCLRGPQSIRNIAAPVRIYRIMNKPYIGSGRS